MWALLNPRVWLAAGLFALLAATHFAAYRSGKSSVRAQWDAAKVQQLVATQKAENDNRKIESKRAEASANAVAAATKKEAVLRSDGVAVAAELGRLRNTVSATGLRLPTQSASACVVAASTGNELLAECAAALTELAEKADRHANDAVMLLEAWPQ